MSERREEETKKTLFTSDVRKLTLTYTHGKSTTKVIQDNPRAGVSSVIHDGLCVCGIIFLFFFSEILNKPKTLKGTRLRRWSRQNCRFGMESHVRFWISSSEVKWRCVVGKIKSLLESPSISVEYDELAVVTDGGGKGVAGLWVS